MRLIAHGLHSVLIPEAHVYHKAQNRFHPVQEASALLRNSPGEHPPIFSRLTQACPLDANGIFGLRNVDVSGSVHVVVGFGVWSSIVRLAIGAICGLAVGLAHGSLDGHRVA